MDEKEKGYNGYSKKERDENFEELKRRLADGRLRPATGPCALCGDPKPKNPFEYHNEDYGMDPFLDKEPALFSLCRNCHRDKLHKRFDDIKFWEAFLAHVRRGGYARDLTEEAEDSGIKKEFDVYLAAIKRGDTLIAPLRQIEGRTYTRIVGKEWFANLRMDRESKWDVTARPRP